MDWLNLHISVLDSPQVLRCDPVRRATWLFLLRYCISQENGGVITDCAAWGDTSWQQIVRVKLREVRAESPLWTWEGNNLRVTFYPSEKETEVQAKRTGGAYGGKAATEAKAQAARENGRKGGRPRTQAETETETQAKETQEPKLNPTEGNGMERNGKEYTPAAAAAVVVAPARPSRPPPPGGSGGARSRIQGIDLDLARQAVDQGDPLECVRAFRGTRDEGVDPEWLRDAAGMMVGELAVVLWLAWSAGKPIRMPSGLRPAREAWETRPITERRALVREAFDDLGIPMPAKAAS